MSKLPLKRHSLMFAPMEGITDITYREVIQELYPQWTTLSTDFLRVSSVGNYPTKHLIKHFGKSAYENDNVKSKTIYQILTSENALTSSICKQLNELEIPWLDINLGCPSKTVVKRHGGSFILSDNSLLTKILSDIRENFKGTLTAKIRVGFKDDLLFEKNLKTIEDLGFDGVVIHARTREQLYKGRADWKYIKQAVDILKIPVIGNGDIWTKEDIKNIFEQTNCHSVMIARGALKSPWLAKAHFLDQELTVKDTANEINNYFNSLLEAYQKASYPESRILKRFKGLSRYVFDDLPDGAQLKSTALRTQNIKQFFANIASI